MLTIEQKTIIQQLQKVADEGDNSCYIYCHENPVLLGDIVTKEVADTIISINPIFIRILPVARCTKKHSKKFIRTNEQLDCDDVISLPHIFGTVDSLNEDLAYYIIDHAEESIGTLIDFYRYSETNKQLDDKFYEYAVNKQLGSKRELFSPGIIPERFFSENFADHVLNINVDVAPAIHDAFWTESIIMLIKQLDARRLEYIPSSAINKDNYSSILEACPMAVLKMDESLVTDEMLINAMNIDKKMHQVYSTMNQARINKPFIEMIVKNSSLYTATLFDDSIRHGVDFNPIDMLIGSKYSPNCITRIKNHFTKEQLFDYADKTKIELNDRDFDKLEKHFDFAKKEPVFMCPCCDKPLPKGLVEAIRNSK